MMWHTATSNLAGAPRLLADMEQCAACTATELMHLIGVALLASSSRHWVSSLAHGLLYKQA
eukprot:313937-Pelagomonas_calceolata.AAC.2